MARSTRERPDDIDLRSLWQSAVRSLPKLAVLAAAIAVPTYGALTLVAPRYVSETQLAIESKSTNNPFADPSRSGSSDSVSVRMDKEAVNTHVRALMSSDLGETIVRDLKLADKPEFNSARGSPDKMSALLRLIGIGAPRASETDQDRALAAYFDRLEVYSPKESRFIGVRFTSSDPELAAQVANRIAETYRESLARQSLDETDEVQQALAPKIAKLADEAATAEAEVEKFRGQANIFKGGGQQASGLNEQQLAELNAELSKVKAARSEAEARAKQAREMLGLNSADTLADVQKSPLIQNLVQSRVRVERQIAELSATLLPAHPRMRQLNADLKGLKVQIAAEVAKIVDGIGKEAKVAGMREEAVEASVAEIKTRIVSAGPEEAKLRSLEADARSKRGELDRLRAQYESNRVRSDDSRAIPVEAQIVSSARPSTVPVFPKKGATALLVAVATMLIGLALVVTRSLLSGARVPHTNVRGAQHRRERPAPVLPDHLPYQAPVMPSPLAAGPSPLAAGPSPPAAGPLTYGQLASRWASDPVQHVESPQVDQQQVEPTQAEPMHAPSPSADPDSLSAQFPVAEFLPAEFPPINSPVPDVAAGPLTPSAEVASTAALAGRLEALRKVGLSGVRTLFAGATDSATLASEAAALCRELSSQGLTVIMIDWSLDGRGIAGPLGAASGPGFSDLIQGKAKFEDVVCPLRDSDVHLIPSGLGLPAADAALDGDSISFMLDALDDVYEHIVVVGRTEQARPLFESTQGRFDCGVTLVEPRTFGKALADQQAGSFLGFEVEGIALFTLERTAGEPSQNQSQSRNPIQKQRQRMARAS